MLRKVASILVAVAVATLAACGQKGPLYVPGVPKGAAWPYPDPPRKAPPAERKAPDLPGTSDERK
jgi:predicted small lipoprotein YifL